MLRLSPFHLGKGGLALLKYVGFAAVLLGLSVCRPVSAESSPTQMVSTEVAAFNAHNAKAVANFHAPTAQLTLLLSGKVVAQGRTAMQAWFAHVFQQNPHGHLTLTKQIVMGHTVVNHYAISGNAGPGPSEVIAIYDVHNNLIANEWLIFPPQSLPSK
jgi:hypothetical protein